MKISGIVRWRLPMAVALSVAFAALGETLSIASAAHPAVVRIIAPENDAISYGSGTLVAVTAHYGLVVTNWHVVRDATKTLFVDFPDGFHSPARLLKIDRDWDLAALAIWRPPVAPLTVATEAPRPGDHLTIAGYGPGWFRTQSGRCTQYVSPGEKHGFEMVELEATARNGDSGGPIFNDRGEIAGVLFGSAFGRTTGSYCGRLRWFLAGVQNDFYSIPDPGTTMLAQRPPAATPARQPQSTMLQPEKIVSTEAPAQSITPNPALSPVGRTSPTAYPVAISAGGLAGPRPGPVPNGPIQSFVPQATPPSAGPVEGTADWFVPLRNFLAVVGAVAVVLQGLRLLSTAAR
jgi:hypothetical protein